MVRKIETEEDLKSHVQLVHRKKPREITYVRAAPRSILHPSDGQVEARTKFGESAKKARGKRGLAPDGLPWAASLVESEMRGFKSKTPTEPKPRVWEQRMTRLREATRLVREAMAKLAKIKA